MKKAEIIKNGNCNLENIKIDANNLYQEMKITSLKQAQERIDKRDETIRALEFQLKEAVEALGDMRKELLWYIEDRRPQITMSKWTKRIISKAKKLIKELKK